MRGNYLLNSLLVLVRRPPPSLGLLLFVELGPGELGEPCPFFPEPLGGAAAASKMPALSHLVEFQSYHSHHQPLTCPRSIFLSNCDL